MSCEDEEAASCLGGKGVAKYSTHSTASAPRLVLASQTPGTSNTWYLKHVRLSGILLGQSACFPFCMH